MVQFLFITDLDNTLVGDDAALEVLNERLSDHRQTYGTKIVYATGRSLHSYQQLRSQKKMLTPDALVAGVGTAIYYRDQVEPDPAWSAVLSQGWNRDRIVATTAHFADLMPQPDAEQGAFKVSFFLAESVADQVIPQLSYVLAEQGLDVNLIYSGSIDLDILPRQANKGLAIAFLRQQWTFDPSQVVACGDSGNDRDLFRVGDGRGIIVGNARSELLEWHRANPSPHRYLAEAACAAGILEGLAHFGFF